MRKRILGGSTSILALAALILATGTSCLKPQTGCLRLDEPPAFNPRLRLDRAALSDAQRRADPGFGPYGDGLTGGEINGDELQSDLAPVFADGAAEKLPQSDCLWLAAGDDPQEPIDFVAAAWEVVVDLQDETPHIDPVFGATRLGQCRTRDPVTGQPWVVCLTEAERGNKNSPEEFCAEAENRFGAEFNVPPFYIDAAAGCGAGPFLDQDIDQLGMDLEDIGILEAVLLEAVAPAPGQDDGSCPARVPLPPPPADDWLGRSGLVKHQVGRFQGTVQSLGPRIGCMRRELLPVTADASFRLVLPQSDPEVPDVVEYLGPNLLTVKGRRTIRRAMTRSGESQVYAWETEVYRGPAGEGLRPVRWQENFSPHTVVESVRIFKEGDGGRQPVTGEAPLRLLGDYGTAPNPAGAAVWECRERVDAGDATRFPIHLEDGSPDCDVRLESVEGTTPTYPLEFLDFAAGPLERPLRWEIETEGVEHGVETVFLEFELRTVEDGAFLTVDPGHDFGNIPVGSSGSGLVTVENVGGNTVVVHGMSLTGPQAADFRFQALGEEVWLPAPYEVIAEGSAVTLRELAGHSGEPDLFRIGRTLGAPSLRIRPEDHDRGLVSLYGLEVSFEHGVPVILDPTALPAIRPSEPGATLPLGRRAYRKAELPRTLSPGESFQVAVTAVPGSFGSKGASLRFAYSQASSSGVTGSVASVLTAEGIAGPLAHVVGSPLVISPGGERRTLLENVGGLALSRGAIFFAGPDAAYFSVESEHATSESLAPGEAEVFTVRYSPPAPLPDGVHEAALEIATGAGTVSVELFGRSPLFTAASLSFDRHQRQRPLYVSNLSPTEPLEVRSASLLGPDRDRFRIVPAPGGFAGVAPGQTALQLHVLFDPGCSLPPPVNGLRQGELLLDTSIGPVQVSLGGTFDREICP